MIACLILLAGTVLHCSNPEASLVNRRGVERSEAQDFHGAAGEFRVAHRIDPDCPVIQINLALACLNSGDLEETESQLSQLGEASPDNPYVVYLTGVLMVRLGQDDEARNAFKRAAKGLVMAWDPILKDAPCFERFQDDPVYQATVAYYDGRRTMLRQRLPATLAEFGVKL